MSDTKTFSLKPVETNLLQEVNKHQQAVFVGILISTVAERVSYPVTQRTQFKLNETLTEIEMSEAAGTKEESAVKAAK